MPDTTMILRVEKERSHLVAQRPNSAFSLPLFGLPLRRFRVLYLSVVLQKCPEPFSAGLCVRGSTTTLWPPVTVEYLLALKNISGHLPT